MAVGIRDKDIIAKSFRMMSSESNNTPLADNYNWSNYFNVFSSATGDNRFVNPLPQFSPATDPRYDRFMNASEGGMGSMYKELYDNNATILTLVPGQPEFAGLLSFLSNMFDPVSAIMANKGRRPYLTFYIGQAATSIAFWPMQLMSIGLEFIQFLMDSPKNRFYTVKQNMADYVSMSSGVLNDIMVKLGFIRPALPNNQQQQTDPLYGVYKGDTDTSKIAQLNNLYNDVIYEDGSVDMWRLITRGQRKHRFQVKALADYDNNLAEGASISVKQKYDLVKSLMERTTQDLDSDQSTQRGQPSQKVIEGHYNTVGAYRENEGLYPEGQSAYLNKDMYQNANTTQYGVSNLGSSSDGQSAIQTVQSKLQSDACVQKEGQAFSLS